MKNKKRRNRMYWLVMDWFIYRDLKKLNKSMSKLLEGVKGLN